MTIDASLLASLIALLVAISSIITALSGKKKTDTDASSLMTQTALKLIEPLRAQLREQDAKIEVQGQKIAKMEKAIVEFQCGTQKLLKQFKRHGIEPDWQPAPYLMEEVVK